MSPNLSGRIRKIRKNIAELTSTIEKLESHRRIKFYIAETIDLIEDIIKYLNPLSYLFLAKQKQDDKEKNDIIKNTWKSLKISQYQHQTNQKKFKMICDNCETKKIL